jgi:peptidoglycan/LPS O-acetylase OafA/YrhL
VKDTALKFGDNIFDILRLWAVLQVAIGHISSHLQVELPSGINLLFGFPGVVVLFTVSGFLVTASLDRLVDYSNGTREYLKRRCLRIFPGLWVSILVSFICILIWYSEKPRLLDAGLYLVTQMIGCNFYTGTWLRGYGVGAPNGSLWTICIELQFYILIMFVWRWLKKQPFAVWITLLLVGSIINALTGIGGVKETLLYKMYTVTLLPYLYLFIIGAMCYRYFDRFSRLVYRYGILLVAILILGMQAGAYYVPVGYYTNLPYGFCLASLTCVLAYVLRRKIRLPFDISYGIYLYHMILVNIFVETGLIGEIRYFWWVMAASILCGIISWYGVEKRWLERTKIK